MKRPLIPTELRQFTRPVEEHISVRDTSNRVTMDAGKISLVDNVGNRVSSTVKRNVVEGLEEDLIIGCDFCSAHAENVCTRFRVAELPDGSIIPIFQGPAKRSSHLAPISSDQILNAPDGGPSRKLCATHMVALKAQTHPRY